MDLQLIHSNKLETGQKILNSRCHTCNFKSMDLLHKEITEKIIKGYYNVYNTLGYGFLEKVYENAMAIELRELGLEVKCQYPITVFYNYNKIGDYFADMLINNSIILELKASKSLQKEHECQLINYLKATNIEVGLLMNFGIEAEYKRKVFMNKFKKLNIASLSK